MDKGTELYKKLIDELAEMSGKSVRAKSVREGNVEFEKEINGVIKKLSPADRNILADYINKAYSDGIFDVVGLLEWYACCRDIKITIDGETLPTDKFEGMQNDFIGRCDGWEFPED